MSNKTIDKSFKTISALGAFFIWGGWAYFINHKLMSAISQGLASLVITLILVHLVVLISNLLPENQLIKIILPAIIAVSITGIFLYIIHSIVGTKRIFYTILPPISVAFIFCLVTALKLNKKHHE